MLANFEQIVEKARQHGPKNLAIVHACSEENFLAAIKCREEKLANAVLFGDRSKIAEGLKKLGANPGDYEIVHADGAEICAEKAIAMAREDKIDVILKGNMHTGELLKVALNKESGLRTGNLLSDILVFEDPKGRLIGLSDGGINVAPDLAAKKSIVENAVRLHHKLGNPCPKVAVLCALEIPTKSMPNTLDAQELQEMNRRGEIAGCEVAGPISFDCAMNPMVAKEKGYESPVGGAAEIWIFPCIEAANISAKALIWYCSIRLGHVVMGAAKPILIPSRTDDSDVRLNSMALAIVAVS